MDRRQGTAPQTGGEGIEVLFRCPASTILGRKEEMSEISQTCATCGGSDIVQNITMSQAVEAGTVGLQYTAALLFGTCQREKEPHPKAFQRAPTSGAAGLGPGRSPRPPSSLRTGKCGCCGGRGRRPGWARTCGARHRRHRGIGRTRCPRLEVVSAAYGLCPGVGADPSPYNTVVDAVVGRTSSFA